MDAHVAPRLEFFQLSDKIADGLAAAIGDPSASDLDKPHGFVERIGLRIRRLEVDLRADNLVSVGARGGNEILVQTASKTAASCRLRNRHAIDVDETRIAFREPAKVRAVIRERSSNEINIASRSAVSIAR